MTPARREALLLVVAGTAAAAAGFAIGPFFTGRRDGMPAAGAEALWSAKFVDLAGNSKALADWRGKVLVCNFWATWCPPCVEEIPMLSAIREAKQAKGVEVVGIAIDSADKVRPFVSKMSMTYPVLLADAQGLSLMRDAGNAAGGLPYTLIADRAGRWVHQKLGALHERELTALLDPLLGP